ncbi:MAG: hypothetical protein ACFHX7_10650 [Pseudomonadota bacterium]
MHLIFLHGAPGVGKRTIATELSSELGFPFLNFQLLNSLLGPVFGYTSTSFGMLRDSMVRQTIEQSMQLPENGLIATFNLDQSMPLDDYATFIAASRESGGIGLFIGLTCATEDLKGRAMRSDRGDASGFDVMEGNAANGLPKLPGPSITIDTTGESPAETVQNIIALLPDDLKANMVF